MELALQGMIMGLLRRKIGIIIVLWSGSSSILKKIPWEEEDNGQGEKIHVWKLEVTSNEEKETRENKLLSPTIDMNKHVL